MKTHFSFRRLILLIFISSLICAFFTSNGQDTTRDARSILAIIRQNEQARTLFPHTETNVFVSEAFAKPVIGEHMTTQDSLRALKIRSERLNRAMNSKPERLVVSECGDMAYEFGNADFSWDTQDKRHVIAKSFYVRIWRKIGGEWLVDVVMFRPDKPAEK